MQQALSDFQSSLGSIRGVVDDVIQNSAAAMADRTVRDRHETYICGSVVLLTGYFETFLKDIVREFVQQISSGGKTFGQMPDKIKRQHFLGGGRVLEQVARSGSGPSSRWGATAEDIAIRLSSVTVTGPYAILWEAFADTRANPSSEVVADVLAKLGVDKPWKQIGAQPLGPGFAASGLKSNLDNLIVLRNSCAHTGRANPMPTTGMVRDFVANLDAIARGVHGVLLKEALKY